VIEEWLMPEDTSDVKVNNAFISIIKVFNANGGAMREILRTAGLPGFRPTVPTPGDPERPALDVTASYVTWSPDDTTIATSICARNRYKNGATEDPKCWVALFEGATGKSKGKFDSAFAPRWSNTNRLIYTNEDSYSDKPQGIYEVNLAVNPPAEQLLIPGTGRRLEPSFYTDRSPNRSPDGSKFVTVRNVDGYHYEGKEFIVHYAIMLFDRSELIGRQILMVDHGESPVNLT
jgi:Tol biopolymer transport system component